MRAAAANLTHVVRGFLRIGLLEAYAYPASFVLGRFTQLAPVLVFAFVSRAVVGDASYFSYVVVGMLVAGLLEAGINGLSRKLASEIDTGRLEGYLIEPVPVWFLPFGLVQFELLTRLGGAVLVAAMAIPLGAELKIGWSLVPALGIVLLGLAAVLSVSIAGAGLQLIAKRADSVLTLYSLGARFFGGVVFPVTTLPGFLQPLQHLFPHTYAIAAVRGLVLEEQTFADPIAVDQASLALVAYVAVAFPISMWLFRRAVSYGRERGLLAGY